MRPERDPVTRALGWAVGITATLAVLFTLAWIAFILGAAAWLWSVAT